MKDKDFVQGLVVAAVVIIGILAAFGWVMNKLIMVQM